MRQWPLAMLCVLAVALLLSADPKNLVPNPTFEGKPNGLGVPPHWELLEQGTPDATFHVAPGEHGGQMLEITNHRLNTGLRMVPYAPLADDVTYIAGGWIRNTVDDVRGSLRLEYGKPGHVWGKSGVDHGTDDDGKWHEFRLVQQRLHDEKSDGSTHISLAAAASGEGKCQFEGLWLTTVPKLPGFATNQLGNGNFEDGRDLPSDTDIYLPKGGKGQWEATADAAHDGLRGVHVHDVVKDATVATGYVDHQHTHDYTLTAWARCRKGEARVRMIYVYDKEWTGWVESDPIPPTDAWTQVTLKYDDSDKAPLAHYIKAAGYVKEGGDADFDSFVMEAVHKPE